MQISHVHMSVTLQKQSVRYNEKLYDTVHINEVPSAKLVMFPEGLAIMGKLVFLYILRYLLACMTLSFQGINAFVYMTTLSKEGLANV